VQIEYRKHIDRIHRLHLELPSHLREGVVTFGQQLLDEHHQKRSRGWKIISTGGDDLVIELQRYRFYIEYGVFHGVKSYYDTDPRVIRLTHDRIKKMLTIECRTKADCLQFDKDRETTETSQDTQIFTKRFCTILEPIEDGS